MKTLVAQITKKHQPTGINNHPPATLSDISAFERQTGFPLPQDFKDFYLICNGFGCNEDIFNVVPLADIRQHPQDFGGNWFYFAEYMIYSDMWGLRLQPMGQYEIFNASDPDKAMTSSLAEFLERFLEGNVFDAGGLYDWHAELGIK